MSVLAAENFISVAATQSLQLLRRDLGISDNTLKRVLFAALILSIIMLRSVSSRAVDTFPFSFRDVQDLQSQSTLV